MIALSDLLAMTARAFQMPVSFLQSPSHRAEIVAARRAYGELARRYTPHSSAVIARPIHKQAPAVSSGWRRFRRHLRDAEFAARFAALDALLAATHARAPERLKTRPKKPPSGTPEAKLAHAIIREFHTCKQQIERIEKAYEHGF
jgi:hypothetical protein